MKTQEDFTNEVIRILHCHFETQERVSTYLPFGMRMLCLNERFNEIVLHTEKRKASEKMVIAALFL